MLEETLRKGNALQSQIAMSNAVLDDYEKLKDEDGFHLRINVLANGSHSEFLGVPVDDKESIEKIIHPVTTNYTIVTLLVVTVAIFVKIIL